MATDAGVAVAVGSGGTSNWTGTDTWLFGPMIRTDPEVVPGGRFATEAQTVIVAGVSPCAGETRIQGDWERAAKVLGVFATTLMVLGAGSTPD